MRQLGGVCEGGMYPCTCAPLQHRRGQGQTIRLEAARFDGYQLCLFSDAAGWTADLLAIGVDLEPGTSRR